MQSGIMCFLEQGPGSNTVQKGDKQNMDAQVLLQRPELKSVENNI